MKNVDHFAVWAQRSSAGKWLYSGIINIVFSKESDNPSVRVEFEDDRLIGQIIFWESGEADADVVEIESELRWYRHWDNIIPPFDFELTFAEFIEIINGGDISDHV